MRGRPVGPRGSDERPRRLRLGIVGFGRMAQRYYAPALTRLVGVESITVADPLERCRAAARASLPRVKVCADVGAVLAARPDALLVASPPSTHLEIWRAAGAAGLFVFMEKPLVLGRQLAEIGGSPAARGRVMVNFNRRFWPTYRQLRTRVREGAIGSPEAAELTLHLDLAAWCEVTPHRLAPGEGGVLHDLGSQMLDLAAWIFPGEPVAIAAESASHQWPDDRMRLRLSYPDGLTVSCDLAYEERTRERVVIHGPGGRLRLDDPNMRVHREGAGRRAPGVLARGSDLLMLAYRAARRSHSMARHSVRAALAAFLDGARRGGRFEPGFDEAVRNVRWLDAASRALATGQPVPLAPPSAP